MEEGEQRFFLPEGSEFPTAINERISFMNKRTYIEQHQGISEEIETIQSLLDENNLEKNADQIALHICTLAGKISVHLSLEDKFMYPKLAESKEEQTQKLAIRYQQQMGGIAEMFALYKDKYNMRQKILDHRYEIKTETHKIFHEIRNRIFKEESELYMYIL